MRRLILLALLLSLGLAAGCGEKTEEPNKIQKSMKDRMKNVKPPPKPQ